MANCLHKLVCRASVVNPILMQSRPLTTPSRIAADRINSMALQRNYPATEKLLLNVDAPLFARNICRSLSTTKHLSEVQEENKPSEGGASEEQLAIVFDNLREDLPQLFVRPLNYSHVHKQVVFENRIHGKTYYGIFDYVKQMSLLRLWGHFVYAYVKLDIIKMTKHTEDSSIKVRWRISGITGYKILFKMIQFRVWNPKEMIEQHKKIWIDGFSTFYVNDEGFVVRHIADKVMEAEDKELNPIEKVVGKLGQVPKLAIFVKLSSDIVPIVV